MKSARCFLLYILILSTIPCFAVNRMKSPLPSRTTQPQKPSYQISTIPFVLTGLIRFYSAIISPADGPRSPSYPTGSIYGIQAIERYGFIPGIFLISDRLLHESDVNLGPIITVYGHPRYFDPLEANTFWWDDSVLTINPWDKNSSCFYSVFLICLSCCL